jgi:hypothetical protein
MSSSHLCPCPACNRHVMTDAGVCPFCQAALPAAFCATSAAPAAPGRMSRAARLLAGATLVGVSACSSTEVNVKPPYGGPPPIDAARSDHQGSGGAGGDAATGSGGAPANDAAEDRSAVALYGGPFPTDGGASG